ncbi:hypothetical protein NQ318_017100 [Aromia moschata]|uniref:Uncharacterized protein n=1 Tax=Aromia moschata TaxID=1265417 RepID=A0AAV8Y5P8_9CUCU|nr:hypothetical protein NQ318_017100 [Aromia moschata]
MGTRLESEEAVKAKATEVLNQLTEADFLHCFLQCKNRMERCRDRQMESVEGEKMLLALHSLFFPYQKKAEVVSHPVNPVNTNPGENSNSPLLDEVEEYCNGPESPLPHCWKKNILILDPKPLRTRRSTSSPTINTDSKEVLFWSAVLMISQSASSDACFVSIPWLSKVERSRAINRCLLLSLAIQKSTLTYSGLWREVEAIVMPAFKFEQIEVENECILNSSNTNILFPNASIWLTEISRTATDMNHVTVSNINKYFDQHGTVEKLPNQHRDRERTGNQMILDYFNDKITHMQALEMLVLKKL